MPDRALRACWKGRVAASKVDAQVFANARETRRLNTSPVAMPRIPPSGLRKAVMRAKASAAAAVGGQMLREPAARGRQHRRGAT